MPNVPEAYNVIGEKWRRARLATSFRERSFVDQILENLAPGDRVLDVGCGMGAPIGRYVVEGGFRLTGIDGSARLLEHARRELPAAELIHGDMREVVLNDRFEALIAWDSVFHVPKSYHADLFKRFRSWLSDGRRMLISLGGSDDEFIDTMYDQEFFYSGWAPEKSIQLLVDAGFEIIHQEIDDPSSRGHLAVICTAV